MSKSLAILLGLTGLSGYLIWNLARTSQAEAAADYWARRVSALRAEAAAAQAALASTPAPVVYYRG